MTINKSIFMIKNLSFFILINCFIFKSISQTDKQLDSLNLIVTSNKNDSLRVNAMNKIAFHYIFNDQNKARKLLQESLKITLNNNLKYGFAETNNILGILMDVSGVSDSAYYYFKKAYSLGQKGNFNNIKARSLNNIGMYHYNRGDYNQALSNFFQTLKINELLPADEQIKASICYNNIGLIYQELDLIDKALSFHQKAYALRLKDQALKDQAVSLNNIGICYKLLKKYDLSVSTYLKGIAIAKNAKDDVNLYKIYENLGNVLQSQGKVAQSIPYYNLALQNINRSPKTDLGTYTGLIAAYNELNEPQKALEYSKLAEKTLKENPDLKPFSADFYQYSAQTYYMMGDRKQGETYNQKFTEIIKDNFSDKNTKQIASYEIKYQSAKKDKLLVEQAAAAEKRNLLMLIVSILAIAFAIFGFLIYRQQKLKNQQQNQAFELKQAINQIETQNKLQSQRLAISKDLHDNIGAQLTFIISSVETAKFAPEIENTKLGNKLTKISDFTKDTIVELRDTIWAMNSNEISFEDLQIRISNFIEKASSASEDIAFNFNIDKNLNAIKLTSIIGMNIYRTIQEAINNALKYAKADKIAVNIIKVNDKINIEITDNGIGFDKETIVMGNGLENMQKRIEEINGTFKIESENGTKILIVFNV